VQHAFIARKLHGGREGNIADTVEWGEITDVYEIVDEKPELIGGIHGLQRKAVMPMSCLRANVDGHVIVQFIVDKDGNVREPEAIKSLGFGCNEEAIRVIAEHAKFTPGRQDGKPVAVRVSIPMKFQTRSFPAPFWNDDRK